MPNIDVLIIGQGLAGSCLGWMLHWAGQRVMIVDRGESVTASRIAAGLITPLTGQRMAPTPRYEECYRLARSFYRRIETELSCQLLAEKPAIRRFTTDDEKTFFEQKFADSDDRFAPLKNASGEIIGIEMRSSARLDVAHFLDQTRQHFASLGRFQQSELDPDADIVFEEGLVSVASLDVRSPVVIFCQGYSPIANRWFPTIPDSPTKGEILRVHMPGYLEDRVVHQKLWIVPETRDDGVSGFLVGATYDRVDLDCQPTDAGRDELLRGLKQITAEIPEVLSHVAAVRAGTRRRKPVVGRHHEQPQLFILNGLGSRGALMGPVAAQTLTDMVCGHPILDMHTIIDFLPESSATTGSASKAIRPRSLTQVAHNIMRRLLQPGDVVIDATAGNGHDTQLLATLVQSSGRTIAIDRQQSAMDRTAEQLATAGVTADLRPGDHAVVLEELQTSGLRIKAAMFNLGYLPGGDKRITTTPESTCTALRAASQMLLPGGVITIIAYRGHAGGQEETTAVEHWAARLSAERFETSRIEGDPAKMTSPVLFVVRNIA